MKILYLHSLSHMGGGETTLFSLLTHLDKSRFSRELILPQEGPLAANLRNAGVPVHIFPFPRGLFNRYPPGFSVSPFLKMLKLTRESGIDCIHVNDSYLVLYGGLLSKFLQVPLVMTSHGWWDAHFLHQELLNKFFVDKFFCVSNVVKLSISRRGWIKEDKAVTTYLGIDTEKFKPLSLEQRQNCRNELGIGEDEIAIIVLGRLILRKGFEEFFKAACLILKSFEKVKFLIVGDKIFDSWEENDSIRNQILQLVQSNPKLKERCIFTGFREDTELLLGSSDILVSAAWWETLGVAILEGMACEIPVVSTNAGGPSETVLDKITGTLIPPKNPEAIAKKTLDLIHSPEKRKAMGQAGRERVLELFSLKRYVQQIQNLYLELIS